MSFSISFGDAYLMGKLAFKIGQAFTKGKKSAPAEFREVESQLYSLSAALNAFSTARESSTTAPLIVDPSELPDNVPAHFAENRDIILGMLRSCQETLSHLDDLVKKYSIITKQVDSAEPRAKRWSKEMLAGWRKVAWTTEGGDLGTLKANLTIQTNSLNLILGVVINSQADRLQTDMDHISTMLGDIHEWFVENLKGKAATALASTFGVQDPSVVGAAVVVPGSGEDQSSSASKPLYFELHAQSGQSSNVICEKASLTEKVSRAYYSSSLRNHQLFSCNCSSFADNVHRSSVEGYGVSPLSFAARIAGGERSWLLYKVADRRTDQLTSLIVKGVPPEVMYDFEELLVHGLSVIQTRQMLKRSMSTMLAHASSVDEELPRANILDLVSNPTTLHRSVSAVRFTSGNVQYARENVHFIQMLHYKSIELSRILDEVVLPQSTFEESRKAEIVITYGKQDRKSQNAPADTFVRSILHCEFSSGSPTAGDGANPAAAQMWKEMEAIRMDLFVIDLQNQRDDEKVLVKLQAQDVHTERMLICDADIFIFQNVKTRRLRLVVKSKNGYTVAVAEDFFQTLAFRGRPDYNAPSFEVYMDASGKRVVKRCPRGFTHLVFSDHRIEQVFDMGLAAIVGPKHVMVGSQPMEGVVTQG
ncbi:hypothetical protein DCS_03764 [Drechmeria coniospora]|uniref:Fungal N-terminal domain-containing protein n=1 Tax=Drechmeria coniospora TaxID=98403 RepID=A0A151GI43_DRECN|nr:hypothetical protein DCS_03764 [Drechmeria coniospora]KYK56758.1 hypothetical protein DCS_03764 [Drechmeria coniospora]